MSSPIALVLALAALFAPLTARAQSEAPPASPAAVATPTPEHDPGLRLRLGVGGEGGGLFDPDNDLAGAGAVGAYLRLGLQFNDLAGMHLTGAASSLLLTSYARGALVVDFSPVDYFSAGTGFSVAGTHTASFGHGGNDDWIFLGAPIALGFYTQGRDLRTDARHGLGFTFTGTLGYAERGDDHGFGGGLTLSIGYEMR